MTLGTTELPFPNFYNFKSRRSFLFLIYTGNLNLVRVGMHKIFSTLINMSVTKVPSAEVKLNFSKSLVFLDNCSLGNGTKVKWRVHVSFLFSSQSSDDVFDGQTARDVAGKRKQ